MNPKIKKRNTLVNQATMKAIRANGRLSYREVAEKGAELDTLTKETEANFWKDIFSPKNDKKVVWVSQRLEDTTFLTMEQCLKKGIAAGELWLVDADQPLKELWGDDWDDAPAEHNAGPPYEDRCRGLIKLKIRLGRPLEKI
jgi:hypothetical protein